MDREVTYADLKLTGNTGLETSSSPSLPQDVCQRPTWRQFALKLACTGIILLALALIGLSVSVIFLKQKSSTEKSNVDVQEKRNETTERPSLLKCPMHWHLFQEKCLFFSNNHKPWNDSLAHCSTQESSLLLIQNQEELPKGSMQMEVVTLTSRSSQFEILNKHVFISNLTDKSLIFWIGLNFTLPEKKWKWINGSFLNSNILEIVGDNKENSCAHLSSTKVISEYCDGENRWICQKELKSIRNKGYPDS